MAKGVLCTAKPDLDLQRLVLEKAVSIDEAARSIVPPCAPKTLRKALRGEPARSSVFQAIADYLGMAFADVVRSEDAHVATATYHLNDFSLRDFTAKGFGLTPGNEDDYCTEHGAKTELVRKKFKAEQWDSAKCFAKMTDYVNGATLVLCTPSGGVVHPRPSALFHIHPYLELTVTREQFLKKFNDSVTEFSRMNQVTPDFDQLLAQRSALVRYDELKKQLKDAGVAVFSSLLRGDFIAALDGPYIDGVHHPELMKFTFTRILFIFCAVEISEVTGEYLAAEVTGGPDEHDAWLPF